MTDGDNIMILGYEETYSQRLDEIRNMISFMILLEVIELGVEDDSYHTIMARARERAAEVYPDMMVDVVPSYSMIASVIRSNAKIMIYNMIEYTASSLLQAIYDRINDEQCGYADVSAKLKDIWHRSHLFKRIRDPNANDETIEQTSKRLLELAISNATLEFGVRDIVAGGNLDGDAILTLFRSHGVKIHTLNSGYRQDELKDIKTKRNELAHGSISFSDAGNQVTVSDLQTLLNHVDSFLTQLREDVITYLNERQYRET